MTDTPMVKVTINLPEDLVKRGKIHAILTNQDFQDLIRVALMREPLEPRPPFNLARLSDREFRDLEQLVAQCERAVVRRRPFLRAAWMLERAFPARGKKGRSR